MAGAAPLVALDAMGGDHAPRETVAGAVLASRAHGVRVVLVGRPEPLRALLGSHGASAEIGVAPAAEVIPMGSNGLKARNRTDTSIGAACELVRGGGADALVSAGSTGGTVATAMSLLGCAPGVLRPAIAVPVPAARSPVVLLDAGATADPSPQMLAQFAALGAAYARAVLGNASPTVGLLTIGAEPGKGNRLARLAQPLLAAAPVSFIGNVEGGDILAGTADVVVTDGFTGNVALKAIEASLRMAVTQTAGVLTAGPVGTLAALAHRRRLRRVTGRFGTEAHGGAALLGICGTVVIAHGSSQATAIARACELARDLSQPPGWSGVPGGISASGSAPPQVPAEP